MHNKEKLAIFLVFATLVSIIGVMVFGFSKQGNQSSVVWLHDSVGDTMLERVDIRKITIDVVDGTKLGLAIMLNAPATQGANPDANEAIWYNFALDVNPETGKKEHGISKDYWGYVGRYGNRNGTIAGLGRYHNGTMNSNYRKLNEFKVSGNIVSMLIPLSDIGNPRKVRCYVHSFDNTTGTTYKDSAPNKEILEVIIPVSF